VAKREKEKENLSSGSLVLRTSHSTQLPCSGNRSERDDTNYYKNNDKEKKD
jgi:hypothetical protein